MLTFLRIAFRNIIRNRRRSLLTLSAVGFGLGALIFIWAFVDGAHRQMIENFTSLNTGHIQIHKKGFQENPKLEMYISGPERLREIVRAIPGVKATGIRIRADGLVSSAESSSGCIILGVDPGQEKTVSRLPGRITKGNFLTSGRDSEIVAGAGLARNLNVIVGDKVVILSQALDGSIASAAYTIAGLFDTGAEEIDKGLVMVTLAAARELFVMPEKASEIVLRVTSGDEADRTARILSLVLRQKNLADSALAVDPELEVLPWTTLSPIMKQWIEFDNAFVGIIVFVVMIVVAIGILNTVLMGVLERTREFGILLAVGTLRRQVIAMVAWESFFLGLAGSIAGLAIGLGLTAYFSRAGIDLTVFTSALNAFYMDAVIYPIAEAGHVLTSIVLVLATSVAVSVYPAYHAANLKPVEAIRSI